MQPTPETPAHLAEPVLERPVPNLELKARLLLLFTVLLVAGATSLPEIAITPRLSNASCEKDAQPRPCGTTTS